MRRPWAPSLALAALCQGAQPAQARVIPRNARYSALGGKAHGIWNPEPGLVELIAEVGEERIFQYAYGDRSEAAYGPKPEDWNLGTNHYPSYIFDLVPMPVVDLCGGELGLTKWNDVSESCAKWVVKMLRCEQVCNYQYHFEGFGTCMHDCAGEPKKEWCEEAKGNEKIYKHCNMFVGRWDTCGISKEMWKTTSDFTDAIDGCVYNCRTAMETEMFMGQTVQWRQHKCANTWFACGHGDHPIRRSQDPFSCGIIDPLLCEGPVGQGVEPCYYDSPWCGDEWWGCYPRPADDANTTETVVKNKDGTETHIVHIENATGHIVQNVTMPRLPYIKPVPAPQWFTIVRPTPFPVPPTPMPPCTVNVTIVRNISNKTDWFEMYDTVLVHNGSWNYTSNYCFPPSGLYGNVTKGNDHEIGPLPKTMIAKLKAQAEKKAKKAAAKAKRKAAAKKKKGLLQLGGSVVEGEEAAEEEEEDPGGLVTPGVLAPPRLLRAARSRERHSHVPASQL